MVMPAVVHLEMLAEQVLAVVISIGRSKHGMDMIAAGFG